MAGFWAGFGTQFSKDVGEIRKELREDSRDRKDYMDRYGAKTISDAQAKADGVLSMINESVAKGVDKKAMLGIWQKSGVKGIKMFHKALLERPNLSIDDYQSISQMGREWVKDTDLDLTDSILRAMNVYHDPNANQGERNENFLQGIISGGYGDTSWMDEARFSGGLTARDVKRIETGTTPSASEGSIDVLDMLGPKPLSETAEERYEKRVLKKFIAEWTVRNAKVANLIRDTDDETVRNRYKLEQTALLGMKTNGYQAADLEVYARNYDTNDAMYRFIDHIEDERAGSMSTNPLISGTYSNRDVFANNLKEEGRSFKNARDAQVYADTINQEVTILLTDANGRNGIIRRITPTRPVP